MSKTCFSQYPWRVTHKSGWIAERVAHLAENNQGHDARYLGYFECFNAGEFYEAHDVLEDLWLETRGTPDADFYKALIQLAGGFVHLIMHENPKWPAAGHRLRPAHRLLGKARGYLKNYPNPQHGLNVTAALALIDQWRTRLEEGYFEVNPLHQHPSPTLNAPR
jgi:hypothetical protein